MTSCVSFLPPSSLHHDMTPTAHIIQKDSLAEGASRIYGHAFQYVSGYHHRRGIEMEDNDATALRIGYSRATYDYSYAADVSWSFGEMADDDGKPFTHRNLMFRLSGAADWHEGDWHGHWAKLQVAHSRGYGRYQDVLLANVADRDEDNLISDPNRGLWSFGYGTYAECDLSDKHTLGFGMGYNYSTDTQKDGFRADYYNLEIHYRFMKQYELRLGGMLDGRITPRAETGYLGLGYVLDR